VGKRYDYARYFWPDRNPVIIEVLRPRAGQRGGQEVDANRRAAQDSRRGAFRREIGDAASVSDDPRRIRGWRIQSNFSFRQVHVEAQNSPFRSP